MDSVLSTLTLTGSHKHSQFKFLNRKYWKQKLTFHVLKPIYRMNIQKLIFFFVNLFPKAWWFEFEITNLKYQYHYVNSTDKHMVNIITTFLVNKHGMEDLKILTVDHKTANLQVKLMYLNIL